QNRREQALGLRAAEPRAKLHLRQHRGGHRLAVGLLAVRQGMRARQSGWRMHGQQRRHLPDLASVRRATRPEAIMSSSRIGPDAKGMLKHGAGGRAMRELIQQVFVGDAKAPADGGIGLAAMDDGAALRVGDEWLVMTTDSYVVKPPFFPGGGVGHGERSVDDGRDRDRRADMRRDYRGGLPPRRPGTDQGVDQRCLRGGRYRDRYRRNQGDGPR